MATKNFGLGTPRLNEGLIISGSAGYESGFSSLIVTGSAVFNEGGEDMDFRVESDSVTHMLFVDGGNNRVAIGTDSPSTPLHVYADASNGYVATIDNDAGSAGHGLKVTSDGSGTGTYLLDLESGSTTLFRFRADGRLGIGTTTPGQLLTVDGDIGIGTQLVHKGDSDTFIEFSDDEINIEVGGRQMIKMTEAGTDKIIINNAAVNVDVQIKGENHANLLRTDASNDAIGIKTNSPGSTLDVAGSISLSVGSPQTGDYSLLATDQCVIADCNGGPVEFTLPSATDGMAGRIYTIKRLDSGDLGGGNLLTVNRNGKNIDGTANNQVMANKDALIFQCVGATSGWIIIGSYMAPL